MKAGEPEIQNNGKILKKSIYKRKEEEKNEDRSIIMKGVRKRQKIIREGV